MARVERLPLRAGRSPFSDAIYGPAVSTDERCVEGLDHESERKSPLERLPAILHRIHERPDLTLGPFVFSA